MVSNLCRIFRFSVCLFVLSGPQTIPQWKSLYQAGFLVARRRPETIMETIEILKKGNYVEGYHKQNGWGGKGYGGFVGGMAMQGLMAYYYDIVRPNTAIELNQCRYNHMGYVFVNIYYYGNAFYDLFFV